MTKEKLHTFLVHIHANIFSNGEEYRVKARNMEDAQSKVEKRYPNRSYSILEVK